MPRARQMVDSARTARQELQPSLLSRGARGGSDGLSGRQFVGPTVCPGHLFAGPTGCAGHLPVHRA
eukprot:5179663-Lingulodinium_polyedra.AAC.1